MKNERRKNIKKIARDIVKLEKLCQAGKNIEENKEKIKQAIEGLTLDELLKIDTYIQKKKFLTK